MKWNNSSAAPPPTDRKILAYDREEILVAEWDDKGFFTSVKGECCCCDGYCKVDIEKWTELPNLTKEEE